MRSGGGAQALTPHATGAAGRGPGEQDSLFEAPAAAGPTSSGPDRDSAARAFGLRPTSGFEVAEELPVARERLVGGDRKSTRLNSSHVATSYAVFCWNTSNVARR